MDTQKQEYDINSPPQTIEQVYARFPQHRDAKWEIRTNRHTTTWGEPWGWVDIAPYRGGCGNVSLWHWEGKNGKRISGLLISLHEAQQKLASLESALAAEREKVREERVKAIESIFPFHMRMKVVARSGHEDEVRAAIDVCAKEFERHVKECAEKARRATEGDDA